MKGNTKEMYEFISNYISKSDIYAASVIAKISAFIINYRYKTGMTQKEFAKFMGVTQGMISKWESAEYNFSVESIAQIAEKLGVTVDITFTPEQEYLANARINSHYRQDTPWAQVLSFVPKAPIPTDLNAVA
ncbi:Transcriptional regulator, contains XRE-family HTH domain [Ruminococcaceae bacterium P7]|nr:Transcriptional regulator, contains XRE-family HTH domain [Ruminococcaceae bacterium P7]